MFGLSDFDVSFLILAAAFLRTLSWVVTGLRNYMPNVICILATNVFTKAFKSMCHIHPLEWR